MRQSLAMQTLFFHRFTQSGDPLHYVRLFSVWTCQVMSASFVRTRHGSQDANTFSTNMKAHCLNPTVWSQSFRSQLLFFLSFPFAKSPTTSNAEVASALPIQILYLSEQSHFSNPPQKSTASWTMSIASLI